MSQELEQFKKGREKKKKKRGASIIRVPRELRVCTYNFPGLLELPLFDRAAALSLRSDWPNKNNCSSVFSSHMVTMTTLL